MKGKTRASDEWDRLRRTQRLRLILVWLALIGSSLLGTALGLARDHAFVGLVLGLCGGWFLSFVVGLAFEDSEYRLIQLTHDRRDDPSTRR